MRFHRVDADSSTPTQVRPGEPCLHRSSGRPSRRFTRPFGCHVVPALTPAHADDGMFAPSGYVGDELHDEWGSLIADARGGITALAGRRPRSFVRAFHSWPAC